MLPPNVKLPQTAARGGYPALERAAALALARALPTLTTMPLFSKPAVRADDMRRGIFYMLASVFLFAIQKAIGKWRHETLRAGGRPARRAA